MAAYESPPLSLFLFKSIQGRSQPHLGLPLQQQPWLNGVRLALSSSRPLPIPWQLTTSPGHHRGLQAAALFVRCLHSTTRAQSSRHALRSGHLSRQSHLRPVVPLNSSRQCKVSHVWSKFCANGSLIMRHFFSIPSHSPPSRVVHMHTLWAPEQLHMVHMPEVHLGRLWAYGRDAASEYARAIVKAWDASAPMMPAFPWNSVYRVWEEKLGWLPAYARSSYTHISIINSLNTMGNHVPKLVGLVMAEVMRSSSQSGACLADGVSYVLQVGEEPAWGPQHNWWHSMMREASDALISITRILHLIVLFVPLLLSSPLALYTDFRRPEWVELLRKTLEAAGPAFIKWGQWAATRHDLFPPDICSELELLHAQAPAHSTKYSYQAVENSFGMKVSDLFEEFDEQALASGSIGQVHRAVLGPKAAVMTGFKPGTVVAVKVRHPGVGSAIIRDFGMMMWVAHMASGIPALQDLRLEETLKQFAAPLREQVDLSREAHNLFRFNRNFAKTRHVKFPVPLYPLVSPDVLVETFEDGHSISKYIVQEGSPYNPRLAVLGSAAMLKMMLIDNLIHSDLHPGNILVRLDPPSGLLGLAYKALDQVKSSNTRWGTAPWLPAPGRIHSLQAAWQDPRIVLLDVGMATELSKEDQKNMLGLFKSFASMDAPAVADWVLSFSGPDQTCPDPVQFKQDMIHHFNLLKKMDAQPEAPAPFTNAADALAQVLELVRQHRVSLPGHICAVVVTTLVLEGWSNKLDPEHSVMTQVQSMFDHGVRPWGDRISKTVDTLMEQQEAAEAIV